MTYAQIIDDEIVRERPRLPPAARRLDTRQWVMGLENATVEAQQATGWVEVVDTARPDDTDEVTHTRDVALVDGVPTVVWTPRLWTEDELAARERAANYVPPEKRLDALERVLVDKAVATEAEITAARETRLARR